MAGVLGRMYDPRILSVPGLGEDFIGIFTFLSACVVFRRPDLQECHISTMPFPSMLTFRLLVALYITTLPITAWTKAVLRSSSLEVGNHVPLSYTNNRISCYKQPPYPAQRLLKAELKDCLEAQKLIREGDKHSAPMDFDTDPAKGYAVPQRWAYQDCQIVLRTAEEAGDEAHDTFSLDFVAFVAGLVINVCVKDWATALGGDSVLGPKKQFEVIVAGLLEGDSSFPALNNSKPVPHFPLLNPNIATS